MGEDTWSGGLWARSDGWQDPGVAGGGDTKGVGRRERRGGR